MDQVIVAPNFCIQVKFIVECVNIDIISAFARSADVLLVRANVIKSRLGIGDLLLCLRNR